MKLLEETINQFPNRNQQIPFTILKLTLKKFK